MFTKHSNLLKNGFGFGLRSAQFGIFMSSIEHELHVPYENA